MLLGLARWLQFLGFQTWCFQTLKEVSELLQKDPKIIYLTCSKSHIQQLKPKCFYLITEDLIERQLHTLNDRFKIFQSARPFTLCTDCNVAVEEIDKKEIKNRVPRKVHYNFKQFWQCPDCQHVYWKGGHVLRLKEKLTRMKISLPK
jgi:uncharacterized protein with PIN domain